MALIVNIVGNIVLIFVEALRNTLKNVSKINGRIRKFRNSLIHNPKLFLGVEIGNDKPD